MKILQTNNKLCLSFNNEFNVSDTNVKNILNDSITRLFNTTKIKWNKKGNIVKISNINIKNLSIN